MRSTYFVVIKKIVVSIIISFILYFVILPIAGALFAKNMNVRYFVANVLVGVLYNSCLYLFHFGKRDDLYYNADNKFSIINELKTYFTIEGKYIATIYAILTVGSEIIYLIFPNSPNLIATFCIGVFPLARFINIPIIRAIICYIIAMIAVALLVIINSFRIYKYWNNGSK